MLPAAVRLSRDRDGELSTALTPLVETALNDSVRRDPTVLTDAIFPIIGPAIRKSIAEALAGLLQSLNQTLEHTLSPQSFAWRLEARRTGKSFAEVVVSRTLDYRVEQVFLIHKETGLLLQHVHRTDGTDGNADLVSGMLTAIQDFARDSFGIASGETLETMRVGDLNVWLNTSPHVTLAAVIRGAAPQEFRTVLQSAIEQIHRDQAGVLEAFDGDAAPFATVRPRLEDCLRMRTAAQRAKRKNVSKLRWLILLALTALAAGGWVVNHQKRSQAAAEEAARAAAATRERSRANAAAAAEQARRQDASARWAGLVRELRSREGIVVTEANEHGGNFHVTGLRDPLAVDPASLLAGTGLDPARITMDWEPYHTLRPGLVLQRARHRLQPPPGVTLRWREDTLVAEGSAPATWIAAARRLAEATPGVLRYDDLGVRDETAEQWAAQAAQLAAQQAGIEATGINFAAGLAMGKSQEEKLIRLSQQIAALHRTARTLGHGLSVTVTGHTSRSGTPAANAKLGRDRAQAVIDALRQRLPEFTDYTAATAPESESTRPDQAGKLHVTFRVEPRLPAPGTNAP